MSDSAIPWSLPGSSVHGMLRARVLEWSGIKPRSPACRQILYHLSHQEAQIYTIYAVAVVEF